MANQRVMCLEQAVGRWRIRQKADGAVASALVVLAVFQGVQFLNSPSAAKAWALSFMLGIVFLAGLRLLKTAAHTARILRQLRHERNADELEAGMLGLRPAPAAVTGGRAYGMSGHPQDGGVAHEVVFFHPPAIEARRGTGRV
jgi:hypothetical protein